MPDTTNRLLAGQNQQCLSRGENSVRPCNVSFTMLDGKGVLLLITPVASIGRVITISL